MSKINVIILQYLCLSPEDYNTLLLFQSLSILENVFEFEVRTDAVTELIVCILLVGFLFFAKSCSLFFHNLHNHTSCQLVISSLLMVSEESS